VTGRGVAVGAGLRKARAQACRASRSSRVQADLAATSLHRSDACHAWARIASRV